MDCKNCNGNPAEVSEKCAHCGFRNEMIMARDAAEQAELEENPE